MRTPWLVLVALAAVAAHAPRADAKRAILCDCPQRIVLPAWGATDVPLNAKVWILDEGASDAGNLHVGSDLPLSPNFHDTPQGTSFQTGTTTDTTPPLPLNLFDLSIIVNPASAASKPIDVIKIFGQHDRDTALIEIQIFDQHDPVTLYTTRDRTSLCSPGRTIIPGRVRVALTAIDLAGNKSEPVNTFVDVVVGQGPSADACGEGPRQYYSGRHFRCGTGDMALLLLIPVVVIGLLLGLLVVRLIRNARIRRAIPTEVGLLVAEAVVRLMLRGHLISSAIGMVAIGISIATDSHGLGFALAVIPFMGLTNALSCKAALRRIDRQGAWAERRDTWLIVSDISGETRVRANVRIFEAAKRAALPAASIDPRGDR